MEGQTQDAKLRFGLIKRSLEGQKNYTKSVYICYFNQYRIVTKVFTILFLNPHSRVPRKMFKQILVNLGIHGVEHWMSTLPQNTMWHRWCTFNLISTILLYFTVCFILYSWWYILASAMNRIPERLTLDINVVILTNLGQRTEPAILILYVQPCLKTDWNHILIKA